MMKEIAEYVGRTYKYGSNLRLAMENLAVPRWTEPADPAANATRTQTRIWEKQIDKFVKHQGYFEEKMKTLYSLVWGQCTEAMRAKVEACANHNQLSVTGDVLALLANIKNAAYSFQTQKYMPQALHEMKCHFYMCQQDKHMPCQPYLEHFKNQAEVIDHLGRTVKERILIEDVLQEANLNRTTASDAELQLAIVMARMQYLSCALIISADCTQYGQLLEDLENEFVQGTDKYPKTLTAAYSLLIH
jgi:hypothetical protein